MKPWLAVLLITGLVFLPACALRINRQAPYRWDMRGRIVSVEGDALVVRHKTGQRVHFVIDAGTEILIGGQPATPASLVAGKRVTVDVTTDAAGVSRALRVVMSP